MKSRSRVLPMIVAVLVGFGLFAGTPDKDSPRVVDFATVEDLIQNAGDTVYVLNFWATWCKPCIQELPDFEKIEKKYIDDPKKKVLLLSLDFTENIGSLVIPFMERHKVISEVWILDEVDANSWIDKIDPSWSGAIPATLIVGNGSRYFHEGIMGYNELDSLINRIQQ